MSDKQITLDEAVEEIAARRELYGAARGVGELATEAMEMATSAFRDGKDDEAKRWRTISKWLSEQSSSLFDEWRHINQNNGDFVQIVTDHGRSE